MFVGPTNCQVVAASCGSDCPAAELVLRRARYLGASFFQGPDGDPAVNDALGEERVLRRGLFRSCGRSFASLRSRSAWLDLRSEASGNATAASSRIVRSPKILERGPFIVFLSNTQLKRLQSPRTASRHVLSQRHCKP